MAFRDENEALRQRVQTLEEELSETRQELEELRNPPKVRVEIEEAKVESGGLAAKVAAKERTQRATEERRTQRARERHRKRLAELEEHGSRLKVTRSGSETVIEVGPRRLRDQLMEQAFGVFVAAIFPGGLVITGLALLLTLLFETLSFGTAMGLAVPLWLTILAALNLVYAHVARPRFRIALDGENFEVKKTGHESTEFLGRRKDLDVRVDDKAPGEVSFRHRSGRATIKSLIQDDLDAIRELLVKPATAPKEAESLHDIMKAMRFEDD